MEDLFEDNCGNAHLQALEMLATESNIKCRGMDKQLHEKCSEAFAELEKLFDLDDLLEEAVEAESSKLTAKGGLEEAEKDLQAIGVSNMTQLHQLEKNVKQLSELFLGKQEQFAGALAEEIQAKNWSAVKDLFPQLSELAYQDTCRLLADLAEKSCEQILRIAEILLMQIAQIQLTTTEKEEKEKSKDDLLELAKTLSASLRNLALLLLTELHQTCHGWMGMVNEMSAELSRQCAASLTAEDGEWRAKIDDEAAGRIKHYRAQIDRNVSTTMTFVQEAIHSNLPILKLLLLTSAQS